MSLHRFFLDESLVSHEIGARMSLPLSSEDVHHALRSLRIKAGESLEVVEPTGHVCEVCVLAAEEPISVELVARAEPRKEPRVLLVQGLAKGDKMDLIVEKAVEVGVSEIVPALFDRSVVPGVRL